MTARVQAEYWVNTWCLLQPVWLGNLVCWKMHTYLLNFYEFQNLTWFQEPKSDPSRLYIMCSHVSLHNLYLLVRGPGRDWLDWWPPWWRNGGRADNTKLDFLVCTVTPANHSLVCSLQPKFNPPLLSFHRFSQLASLPSLFFTKLTHFHFTFYIFECWTMTSYLKF